jgi:hypothetical protein
VQTNLALIRVWRHKIIYSCWRQNFKKGLLRAALGNQVKLCVNPRANGAERRSRRSKPWAGVVIPPGMYFLVKVQTHRTRFGNATRFFSFWKLIEQPMRANFERYVEQVTQNVIALLNIWKI